MENVYSIIPCWMNGRKMSVWIRNLEMSSLPMKNSNNFPVMEQIYKRECRSSSKRAIALLNRRAISAQRPNFCSGHLISFWISNLQSISLHVYIYILYRKVEGTVDNPPVSRIDFRENSIFNLNVCDQIYDCHFRLWRESHFRHNTRFSFIYSVLF